jgi:hypothetical protein
MIRLDSGNVLIIIAECAWNSWNVLSDLSGCFLNNWLRGGTLRGF